MSKNQHSYLKVIFLKLEHVNFFQEYIFFFGSF